MSKILIIEDEASIRRVLTKILTEENDTYQVDEAEDGSIGYQNFNNNFSYAEIGYELHPDYHNKGYMNESFKAILNFGFCTMNLKIILNEIFE